jgi:hypothetical protein
MQQPAVTHSPSKRIESGRPRHTKTRKDVFCETISASFLLLVIGIPVTCCLYDGRDFFYDHRSPLSLLSFNPISANTFPKHSPIVVFCCFAAFCGRDKFVNGPIFEKKNLDEKCHQTTLFINGFPRMLIKRKTAGRVIEMFVDLSNYDAAENHQTSIRQSAASN